MTTTVKKFASLHELLDALYAGGYISAEMMSEKRACFKDGASYEWTDFIVPTSSEEHFWKEMAKVVWNKPTAQNIADLRNSKGWWLNRLTWNGTRYSYDAGQDYPYEIRKIQNLVKKQNKS